MITPFACLHLRSCTDKLPEYFVPQPSRDYLLPALPTPEPAKGQVQETPASTPFTHYDEAVFLVCGLVSLFIAEENIDPPKDEDLIWDEAQYFTNQKRWAPKLKTQRCYVPQIHDLELTEVCLTETERIPCDVVPFGYRNGKGELLSSPRPQRPPTPLLNAERYEVFLGISKLGLKSTAKTAAGIKRFREKAAKLWGDNRFTHWLWNSVVSKCCASCGDYHTKKVDSVTVCAKCKTKWRGMRDERNFCCRCGSSVFVPRDARHLKCFDCGLVQGDSTAWWNSKGVGSTDKETTQGVANRSKWLAQRIKFFNPLGKKLNELTPDEIAQIVGDSKFRQQAQEYEMEFFIKKSKDAAVELELKDATLRKRKSRGFKEMFHGVDFEKTIGKYFIVVSLNGRNHLKILGDADASRVDVLKAFFAEWMKTESTSLKQTRQTAKKKGLGKKAIKQLEIETAARIQDAYDTAIGLFVLDADGRGGTYSYFYVHEFAELAAQDSSMTAALDVLGREQATVLESVS